MGNILYPEGNAVIDRGRRLFDLRQTPGYQDLYRISEELVARATDTALRFGGWDKDQKSTLLDRAKTALEHHEALFAEIDKAVRAANEEHEDQLVREAGERQPEDASAEADALREAALSKFEELEKQLSGSTVSMGG